jgi:uncharacterized protein
MKKERLVKKIEEFAVRNMDQYDKGHDWWHLCRVRNYALYIQENEGSGDRLIIEISSLLHDIGDSKFSKDHSTDAPATIGSFLSSLGMDKNLIDEVIYINRNISFSKGSRPLAVSKEFMIVQDADRLDAIGAIGIARAFNYGGFRNNQIFDPEGKNPSTIAHFHDKLLKLKDLMNTESGSRLAEDRHKFLEKFLSRFQSEWEFGRGG